MSVFPDKIFKVLIQCDTFNHRNYISDAINGFASQRTTFPFLAVVIDDNSSDGTHDYLLEWFKTCFSENEGVLYVESTEDYLLYFSRHKNNKNFFCALLLLKYNHYSISKDKNCYYSKWQKTSDYIALCEGDDYWVDENKLQKQVDFLDQNLDYGMCYSNFNILYQNSGRIEFDLFHTKADSFPMYYNTPEEFVMAGGYVAPPSWLIRTNLWLSPPPKLLGSSDGTFVRFTQYLSTTSVYAFPEVMVVYRWLPESASHSVSDPIKMMEREKNLFQTKIKLIEYYSLSQAIIPDVRLKYYRDGITKFVAYDIKEELDEAKEVIVNKNLKERIIFAFAGNQLFSFIIKKLYRIWRSYTIRKRFY